jgi:hypothetical protein
MFPLLFTILFYQSVIESDSEDDGDSFIKKSVNPQCAQVRIKICMYVNDGCKINENILPYTYVGMISM